ncbi:O-antigen ligase family protein [Spongorhabdus nitratireducens]
MTNHMQKIQAVAWPAWVLSFVMLLFVMVSYEKLAVNIFRVAICLPVLLLCGRRMLEMIWANYFTRILALFMLWCLTSLLWSPLSKLGQFDNLAIKILSTLVVVYLVFYMAQNPLSKIVTGHAYVLSALILFANAVVEHSYMTHGFGAFDNPNAVAWFLSSAAIFSIGKGIFCNTIRDKIIYFAFTAVFIYGLVEIGSRAAFLGLIVGILSFAFYRLVSTRSVRYMSYCLVMVVIFCLSAFVFDNEYLIWLLERGDNSRFEIYQNAINSIFIDYHSFLFGHGIAADAVNFTSQHRMAYYHSIYLSTLFYSGLVGFFLFSLCVFRRPFLIFFKGRKAHLWDFVLIGMLATFTFTGDRLFTYPNGFFYAFLLPLLFANAFEPKDKHTSS